MSLVYNELMGLSLTVNKRPRARVNARYPYEGLNNTSIKINNVEVTMLLNHADTNELENKDKTF